MRFFVNDPKAAYFAHKAAIHETIGRVMSSGRYILGGEVKAFEQEFAKHFGAEACVGVGNGTDALTLALQAVGVGPGWKVIVPAFGATATAIGAAQTGAQVVFADVGEDMTIDPESVWSILYRLPEETPACVVAVHLFGTYPDLPKLRMLCDPEVFGAKLVEDCAQTSDRMAGAFGDAASWSFYPTKNLGALGDGGAVTGSKEVCDRVRKLRQYGWGDVAQPDRNAELVSAGHGAGALGRNSRLDEIQAAVLRVKLRDLELYNTRRVLMADAYDRALAGTRGLTLPPRGTYHQYVVRVREDKRESFRGALSTHGVETMVHYPRLVCDEHAFVDCVAPTSRPLRVLTGQVLSLPLPVYENALDPDALAQTVRRVWERMS